MASNQSAQLKSDEADFTDLWKDSTNILEALHSAADSFVHHNDTVEIWAASRDWFLEEWGRDTFIALPGILIVTGRFEEAKEVFRHFAAYEKMGLLPNRISESQGVEYNSVDAPMWFMQAFQAFLKYKQDDAFLEEMLPVIRSIIQHYREGTSFERNGKSHVIQMDAEDGLIISPAQSTWMDADPSGNGETIITPRNGKAVEINALWYANLLFLAELEEKYGEKEHTQDLLELAKQVKLSFNKKFWNEQEYCLFDVIEGDPQGDAIRPNMIIALSHGKDLLSGERQEKILEVVQKGLLTVGGLRTLSPTDSQYRGHYDTSLSPAEKDLAYHQGTVWPWLIGPYCDALVRVWQHRGKEQAEIQTELRQILNPLLRFCLESPFRSLPEVFSGDAPHDPGGTTSQAWSVAEVLRILVEYEL